MNAEIIAVGSELLLGQIANTNAQYISRQLSELGVNVYYHTVIGDNAQRLDEAIAIAEKRADCIIFSGGLGPTKDDLTKETIAKHLQKELVFDAKALTQIETFFQTRKMAMTENNRKQALILAGSEVLANHNGMAPGMLLQQNKKIYILLPGPPKELEPMFKLEAKPMLAKHLHEDSIITSQVLRFYGIGEAALEVELQDLLDNQTNPTLAPLASDGEVTIRITAKSASEAQNKTLIDAMKQQVLARVGQFQYGENDDSLASKVVETLAAHNLTIGAAESLTAGLFQSELAEIAGASQVLVGGFVTYTAEAKIAQLGISAEFLQQNGIVSEACAVAMAQAAQQKMTTNIGIGLTGAAGPSAHGNQPAGTVWLAVVIDDNEPATYCLHLSGMRNTNRLRAVKFTYHFLLQQLQKNGYSKIK